jgi:membrane-bound metal-dependent hydrolase YbcI (DUF457 family)
VNWAGHLLFGAACGAAFAHFALGTQPEMLALFCMVSAASALLPDIDIRSSKISQAAYGAAAALVLVFSLLLSGGDAARMLFCAAAAITGILAFDILVRPHHRGMTHSLLFVAACAAAVFFAAGFLPACAVGVGCASHLVADGIFKLW